MSLDALLGSLPGVAYVSHGLSITGNIAYRKSHIVDSDRRLAIGDLRILYGGSVNSQNIRDFIIHDEISGVLVGGASVDKEEFVKILEVVSKNL